MTSQMTSFTYEVITHDVMQVVKTASVVPF